MKYMSLPCVLDIPPLTADMRLAGLLSTAGFKTATLED